MMFMCTTRFELQEHQRLILQEYLSSQEIAAAKEADTIAVNSFEPISDTEEDLVQPSQVQPTLQPSPNTILGRRQRSGSATEDDEAQSNPKNEVEDDTEIPLPPIQQRSSRRVRKVSKLLNGYVLDKN
jgi:hypothetical protein